MILILIPLWIFTDEPGYSSVRDRKIKMKSKIEMETEGWRKNTGAVFPGLADKIPG